MATNRKHLLSPQDEEALTIAATTGVLIANPTMRPEAYAAYGIACRLNGWPSITLQPHGDGHLLQVITFTKRPPLSVAQHDGLRHYLSGFGAPEDLPGATDVDEPGIAVQVFLHREFTSRERGSVVAMVLEIVGCLPLPDAERIA